MNYNTNKHCEILICKNIFLKESSKPLKQTIQNVFCLFLISNVFPYFLSFCFCFFRCFSRFYAFFPHVFRRFAPPLWPLRGQNAEAFASAFNAAREAQAAAAKALREACEAKAKQQVGGGEVGKDLNHLMIDG